MPFFVIPERQKLSGFIEKWKRAAGKGEIKRAGASAIRRKRERFRKVYMCASATDLTLEAAWNAP